MALELACLSCPCRLQAGPDTPRDDIIQAMTEVGPWFALADGASFEDMIIAALTRRGRILCPECGEPVAVRDASFGDCAPGALIAT